MNTRRFSGNRKTPDRWAGGGRYMLVLITYDVNTETAMASGYSAPQPGY